MVAASLPTFYACEPGGSPKTAMNQNPTLPFDLVLEPNPDFGGGYTIREADGFALIGEGVSYRDIDLQVDSLVGYGVQASAVAAEVIDSEGNTKFIKVIKAPSPSLQPFIVCWATEAETKGNDAYTWVNLPEKN